MRKTQYKVILSVIVFTSMLMTGISIDAAPVKFKQVVQVVNIKPGKAATGSFSKLRLGGNSVYANDGDDDNKDGDGNKKSARKSPQDDRVITTTTEEIVENEQCDCTEAIAVTKGGGFPKWPLFGLAAVPLAFIRTGGGDDNNSATPTPTLILTPTPTTSVTPTGTPPTTPTVTPTTPTVTPTVTPTTPTPTVTPPPPTVTPPAPVPEPMTLLLFGTGLASVGFATRKRFGRKGEKEENNS